MGRSLRRARRDGEVGGAGRGMEGREEGGKKRERGVMSAVGCAFRAASPHDAQDTALASRCWGRGPLWTGKLGSGPNLPLQCTVRLPNYIRSMGGSH
jgi:hypothetical protein